MFTKDMIVQLLTSHAKAIMPSKGMWSKSMKLKNISKTNKDGKLFFVYGKGGTNKTFVWTTLLSRL